MKIRCPNPKCNIKFEPKPGQKKCPYCGISLSGAKNPALVGRRKEQERKRSRGCLTILIGVVLFIVLCVFINKSATKESNQSQQKNIPKASSEQIINILDIKDKTIREMRRELGEPTSYIEPIGEMYGEITWKKENIEITTNFKREVENPQAISVYFIDKPYFNDFNLNAVLKRIGLEDLNRNDFTSYAYVGLSKKRLHTENYSMGDYLEFKLINVWILVSEEGGERITSIDLINRCYPEDICF